MSHNAQWNTGGYFPGQQESASSGQVKMFDPSKLPGNSALSQPFQSQFPQQQQQQQQQQSYMHGSSGTDGSIVNQPGYGTQYQNQSNDVWDQSWNNDWNWSQNEGSEPANGVQQNNWNSQPPYSAAVWNNANVSAKNVAQSQPTPPPQPQLQSQSSTPHAPVEQHWNHSQPRQTPQSWDAQSRGSASQLSTPAPTSTPAGWDGNVQSVQQNWSSPNQQQQQPDWQNYNNQYQGQAGNQYPVHDGYTPQTSYDGSMLSSFYENDDVPEDVVKENENSAVRNMSNQFSDINLDDDSAADSSPSVPQQKQEKPNQSFPSSNSFSNLQHQPSPFDELNSTPVVANTPNVSTILNQTLDVQTQSHGHSRNSSLGGNVQFIIGSDPNSASHSPFGSRNTSQNHSPEVHDLTQNVASSQHPSHLPVTSEGHDEVSAASGIQQTPDEGAAHHSDLYVRGAAIFKGVDGQVQADTAQQSADSHAYSSHGGAQTQADHPYLSAGMNQPMSELTNQHQTQQNMPSEHTGPQSMTANDFGKGQVSGVPQSPQMNSVGQSFSMYGSQHNSPAQQSPFQQVFRPPSVQSNQSGTSDPHHHPHPQNLQQGHVMSPDGSFSRSPFQQPHRPPSVQSNQSNVSLDQNQIHHGGHMLQNQPILVHSGPQPSAVPKVSPFQQGYRSPSVQSNQGSSVAHSSPSHDVPVQQIQRSPSVHSNQSCHADPLSGSGYQNMSQRPSSALSSQSSESSIGKYTAMVNKQNQQFQQNAALVQAVGQVPPPQSVAMPGQQMANAPVMSQPTQSAMSSPPQMASPNHQPQMIGLPYGKLENNYQNCPQLYNVPNPTIDSGVAAATAQASVGEPSSTQQAEVKQEPASPQEQLYPNDQQHMMNIYTSAIQPHAYSPFKPLKKSQDLDSPQNFNQNAPLNPPQVPPAPADSSVRATLPKNYPQNLASSNQAGMNANQQSMGPPSMSNPANVPPSGEPQNVTSLHFDKPAEVAQQSGRTSSNSRQDLPMQEIPPANQQVQQQAMPPAATAPAIPAHVHMHQWQRQENNMSPATTLWKNPEPNKFGVVLAPATPTPTSTEGSPVRSPCSAPMATTQPQQMGSSFAPVISSATHHDVAAISQKDSSQMPAEVASDYRNVTTSVPPVDNVKVYSSSGGNVKESSQSAYHQQDLNSTAPFIPANQEPVQNSSHQEVRQESVITSEPTKAAEMQQPADVTKTIDSNDRNSGQDDNFKRPADRPTSRGPAHEDGRQARSRYDQHHKSRQGDNERPMSRQGYGRDYSRERSTSRQGYDDEYDRSRHGYRDNRERSRSRQGEYYDRPSSRQGYEEEYGRSRSRSRYNYEEQRSRSRTREGGSDRRDRSTSRQRYPDRPHSRSGSRPPSRSDYDDYYSNNHYYRSRAYPTHPHMNYRYRYRGDYDSQYGYGYYDNYRDPYYDDGYYRDPHKERYSRGYYEEMQYYNQNYAGRDQQYDSRYQDYYNQQYSTGYEDVDRHSSHSRSSSRGPTSDAEYDGTAADNFARDFHGQGSRPSSRAGYETAEVYNTDPAYSQSYHDQSYDYSAYDYNAYQTPYVEPPPERRTPVKFSIPHVRASFGPGNQLLKVLPNRPADGQPALVEVHDLESVLPQTTQTQELKSFTGPLVKGETHKNDVLTFCHNMIRECREDATLTDRESAELCWKLLELLIKQNGTIVGTDIAELLLDGRVPTTDEYAKKGISITASSADLDQSNTDNANLVTTSDRTVINKNTLSTEEVTDRFRHLLLYGRKKDALEWAMKNSLWGHALFLASKLDNRTHANVMTKFANSSMRMNDPLQTLYQLMSSRQPAAVTCITDERWGDWRPHLAMILSNHSYKPDLDRKSIIQLGDTLASRRCLYASQFCYLMAQCNFGVFSKKTSKIVLIGSSHVLPWELFANNRAIQCTEVYEYAHSLGSPLFSIPTFQIYKFIYATRLAECGMIDQALHYCEVIANTILQVPVQYSPILFKQLYELCNRLKYSDPQRLHRADDEGDPYWLQQLLRISQCFDDGTLTAHPLSGSETPMGFGSTATGSEYGDGATPANEMTAAQYQSTFQGQTEGQVEGQKTDDSQYQQNYATDTTQQNYSTDQYNSQYAAQQDGQAYNAYGQDSQQQGWSQDQSALYNNTAYAGYPGYAQDGSYIGYTQTAQDPASQQQPTSDENQAQVPSSGETNNQGTVPFNQYSTEQQQAPAQPTTTMTYNVNNFQQFAQKLPNSGDLAASATSMTSTSTETSESTEVDSSVSPKPFDYYAASTQQNKQAPPPVAQPAPYNQSEKPSIAESNEPNEESKPTDGKNKKPKQGGSGWLGGLFNKSWFRGKNEMILPDDKNPSIIWDPVAKRWKNMDGDEEDTKPALPPPKDNELNRPPAASPPGGATPIGAAPPSGNRFSRQKGRGARSQYVDVLNPGGLRSSATAPSSLFSIMPSSTPTTHQIFTPTAATTGESSGQAGENDVTSNEPKTDSTEPVSQSQPDSQQELQQSYQQQPQQPIQQQPYQQSSLPPTQQSTNQQQSYQTPQQQFYNPNQMATQNNHTNEAAAQKKVDPSNTPATSQPKPSTTEDQSAPPPAMPFMYNPAQFTPATQPGPTSTGQRGLRYGQRRAYPK